MRRPIGLMTTTITGVASCGSVMWCDGDSTNGGKHYDQFHSACPWHAGCNLLLLRFLIQYPAKFQVTTTTTHWQCAPWSVVCIWSRLAVIGSFWYLWSFSCGRIGGRWVRYSVSWMGGYMWHALDGNMWHALDRRRVMFFCICGKFLCYGRYTFRGW